MKEQIHRHGKVVNSACDEAASSLFRGGSVVPPGTYIGLQDGHIVRMTSSGCLPAARGYSEYYRRASDYHGELISKQWSVSRL